jgi:hypothetical protein
VNRNHYKPYSYPPAVLSIARERTSGLLGSMCLRFATLDRLLVSAYLQGVCDAAEALAITEAQEATDKRKQP